MAGVYRNLGQLANILRRYSSPVNTGIVVVQSYDVTGSGRRTVDAVFFTRVHFDIFGLFFPRAYPGLDSATRLLMDVYGAESLSLCVASTELSSPPSSLSFSSLSSNSHCNSAANRSLDIKAQSMEVYRKELTTLRRFSFFTYQSKTIINKVIFNLRS